MQPKLVVKAHAEGTVAVKKLVQKPGQHPFTQTFWVKPNEVKAPPPKLVVESSKEQQLQQFQDFNKVYTEHFENLKNANLLVDGKFYNNKIKLGALKWLKENYPNHESKQVVLDTWEKIPVIHKDSTEAIVKELTQISNEVEATKFANWGKVKVFEKQSKQLDITDSYAQYNLLKDLFLNDKDTFLGVLLALKTEKQQDVFASISSDFSGGVGNLNSAAIIETATWLFRAANADYSNMFEGSNMLEQESLNSLLVQGWKGSSRSVGGQLIQYYVSEVLKEKGYDVAPPSYFSSGSIKKDKFYAFTDYIKGTKFDKLLKDQVRKVYEDGQEELKKVTNDEEDRDSLQKEIDQYLVELDTKLADMIRQRMDRLLEVKAIADEFISDLATAKTNPKMTEAEVKLLKDAADKWSTKYITLTTAFKDARESSLTSVDNDETSKIKAKLDNATKLYNYFSTLTGMGTDLYELYLPIKNIKQDLEALEELKQQPSDDDYLTLKRGIKDTYTTSSTLESWTTDSSTASAFDGNTILEKRVPKKAIYTFYHSKHWKIKGDESIYEDEQEYICIPDLFDKEEGEHKVTEPVVSTTEFTNTAMALITHDKDEVGYPSKEQLDKLVNFIGVLTAQHVQDALDVDQIQAQEIAHWLKDYMMHKSMNYVVNIEKSVYQRVRNNKLEVVHDRRVKHEEDVHAHATQLLDEATKTLDKDGMWMKSHLERTGILAGKIARKMGLGNRVADKVADSAMLHDIGKLNMSLISSHNKLTPDEILETHKHPLQGAETLEATTDLKHLADGVRQHHEKEDGSGYPNHLSSKDISIEAKIISVADAFDAIVTTRPYHDGDTLPMAIEDLYKNVGTQFDKRAVDALVSVLRDEKKLPMLVITPSTKVKPSTHPASSKPQLVVAKSDFQRMNIHHGKLVVENVHDNRESEIDIRNEILENPSVRDLKELARVANYHTIRFIINSNNTLKAGDSENFTHQMLEPAYSSAKLRGLIKFKDGVYTVIAFGTTNNLKVNHEKVDYLLNNGFVEEVQKSSVVNIEKSNFQRMNIHHGKLVVENVHTNVVKKEPYRVDIVPIYSEYHSKVVQTEVMINPPAKDMRQFTKDLMSSYKSDPMAEIEARYIKDMQGNVYVWDGNMATHDQVLKHYNIKEEDRGFVNSSNTASLFKSEDLQLVVAM